MFKRIVGIAACLFLVGCVSYPQGVGLEPASAKHIHTKKNIWLKPAVIDAWKNSEDKNTAETSMTLSLQKFLEETGSFEQVSVLPGKIADRDHVLNFRFKNFSVSRSAHPAYFPAAILTLTFYIWFNGPIYIDTININADLYVTDLAGKPVAEFSENINKEINVGFSDPEYYMPSGIRQRTAVVNGLVDQYLAFLQANKELVNYEVGE